MSNDNSHHIQEIQFTNSLTQRINCIKQDLKIHIGRTADYHCIETHRKRALKCCVKGNHSYKEGTECSERLYRKNITFVNHIVHFD